MAPHAWRPPKRRRPNDPDPTTKPEQNKAVPKFAYIRAYEANLNYDRPGPHEQRSATGIGLEADGVAKEGAREGGLIKWAGTFDDEHVEGAGEEREVWADRYVYISTNAWHAMLMRVELGEHLACMVNRSVRLIAVRVSGYATEFTGRYDGEEIEQVCHRGL